MDRFLRLCGIYFLVCIVSNIVTYLFFSRKIDEEIAAATVGMDRI